MHCRDQQGGCEAAVARCVLVTSSSPYGKMMSKTISRMYSPVTTALVTVPCSTSSTANDHAEVRKAPPALRSCSPQGGNSAKARPAAKAGGRDAARKWRRWPAGFRAAAQAACSGPQRQAADGAACPAADHRRKRRRSPGGGPPDNEQPTGSRNAAAGCAVDRCGDRGRPAVGACAQVDARAAQLCKGAVEAASSCGEAARYRPFLLRGVCLARPSGMTLHLFT